MSDSDSDDQFESADEDFHDEEENEIKTINVSTINNTNVQNENIKNNNYENITQPKPVVTNKSIITNINIKQQETNTPIITKDINEINNDNIKQINKTNEINAQLNENLINTIEQTIVDSKTKTSNENNNSNQINKLNINDNEINLNINNLVNSEINKNEEEKNTKINKRQIDNDDGNEVYVEKNDKIDEKSQVVHSQSNIIPSQFTETLIKSKTISAKPQETSLESKIISKQPEETPLESKTISSQSEKKSEPTSLQANLIFPESIEKNSNSNSDEKVKENEIHGEKIESNSDGWGFDDDELDLNNAISNMSIDIKQEDKIIKENKPAPTIISSATVARTTTTNDNLSVETNDAGGDGWDVDIELEDGFEVPTNLNNSGTQLGKVRYSFSLSSPLNRLTDGKDDSWGNWGAWGGVGSILSTATSGVTTITSQVSQGFSQVLGAPNPEELAKLEKELIEKQSQQNKELNLKKSELKSSNEFSSPPQNSEDLVNVASNISSEGLFSFSQISRLVETAGTKVITGGLDTLENLGKKTMEVLQDGDPGLKKKRAILFPNQDKPNLSQVLRDVKDKNEFENNRFPSSSSINSKKNIHFESLLDDYQGLVHLEALEILSKQCLMKLTKIIINLSNDPNQKNQYNDYQETLQQIRDMCQIDDTYDKEDDDDDDEDDHDVDDEEDDQKKQKEFEKNINDIIILYNLENKINCDKLIKVYNDIVYQLDHPKVRTSSDVLYEKCLTSMAEFTSVAMDIFQKTANLLLLKSNHKITNETEALSKYTYLLCSRITWISNSYSKLMINIEGDNNLITNIYLEAANSCSYIQDASQLLIPIIQLGANPIS